MKPRNMLFAIAIVTLASGCSQMVKKPEIHNVKKVALISVFANDNVPEKKRRGTVTGWNDKVKQTVSSNFYNTYADSLKQLGWTVMPMSKVAQSKTYKSMHRLVSDDGKASTSSMGGFLNKLADLSEKHKYFNPNGLHPVHLDSKELNSTRYVNGKLVGVKQEYAALARELGVDAVVVVKIDYCYEGGSFSIGGMGKAYMTADSSIRVIDKAGNLVVNMGDLQACGDGGNRAESDTGYAMVGGNLLIAFAKDDTVTRMFKEATEKNASMTTAVLKKAMQ